MNEPIKEGDLVQVVKPSECIGGDDGLGHIFQAGKIERGENIPGNCSYCGKPGHVGGPGTWDGPVQENGSYWWPLRRLRRIPPLSELEEIRTEQRRLTGVPVS